MVSLCFALYLQRLFETVWLNAGESLQVLRDWSTLMMRGRETWIIPFMTSSK